MQILIPIFAIFAIQGIYHHSPQIVKPKVQIQNFKPKDTTITPPTNNIGYYLMYNAFSLKSWFQKVIEEHFG